MLSDLWYRIRSLLFSRRADAELAEELQFHLDREREKRERGGLNPLDARRQSVIAFGGVAGATEACRDARGVTSLTDLSKDIRYGWRSLRRNPLFALTVVGSLALGIGANVTVFTLMRAALWRPMPVPHPEEIVHLRRGDPARTDGRENVDVVRPVSGIARCGCACGSGGGEEHTEPSQVRARPNVARAHHCRSGHRRLLRGPRPGTCGGPRPVDG